MNNKQKRLISQALFETLMASGNGFALNKEGDTISAIISSESAIDDEGDSIIGQITLDLKTLNIRSEIDAGTAAEKIVEQLGENLKRAAFVSKMTDELFENQKDKREATAKQPETEQRPTMH